MQRLLNAADLLRDRHHRRPAGGLIALVIGHYPHRAFAHLRRKPVRRLAHTGSAFSGVGASGKPGAVHLCILGGVHALPLVLIIPADGRGLVEADLLVRALAGEPAERRDPSISRFERHQLAAMLDVLDAAATGATLRDIAISILFPWLDLDATEWKSSPSVGEFSASLSQHDGWRPEAIAG